MAATYILYLTGLSVMSSLAVATEKEGDNPLDWLRNAIPGEPGTDYPIYAAVEQTSFTCDGLIFGGYYADQEMQCQGYHVCLQDAVDPESLYPVSFLCPNGTIFSQEIFTCDWWYNVDCSTAKDLYGGAEGAFGGFGGQGGQGSAGSCPAASPLPEDQCAGTVSNCWSPGQTDTDCPNNGLCCFDGCADTCVDGPKPEPTPRPTPAPTPRPTPAPTARPTPVTTKPIEQPVLGEEESENLPEVVNTPRPTLPTTAKPTTGYKYDIPEPDNQLIISRPPPGLPTLYGAPNPGRR